MGYGMAVLKKKFSLKWYKICYCKTRIWETYILSKD